MQDQRLAILPLDWKSEQKMRANNKLIVVEDPLGEFLQKWLADAMNLRNDPSVAVRRAFFEFVELLDGDAALAWNAVLAGLDDPDPDGVVKLISARVCKMLINLENLRRIPPREPDRPQPPRRLSDDLLKTAGPGLTRLLNYPERLADMPVRRMAAKALEGLGPLAGTARPALAKIIRTGDVDSRLLVFPIIARLASEDAVVLVEDLKKNLEHPDWRVREGAAKTLGRIGPPARAALTNLRRLIGDPVEEVREAAGDALLSILPAPE